MTDEMTNDADSVEESADAAAEAPSDEPVELIMCYVSKQMVPLHETVEVSYGANKKFRVLPRFVKY